MSRAGRAGRETAAVVVLAVVGSSLGAQTPNAAPATVAQAEIFTAPPVFRSSESRFETGTARAARW